MHHGVLKLRFGDKARPAKSYAAWNAPNLMTLRFRGYSQRVYGKYRNCFLANIIYSRLARNETPCSVASGS